MKALIIILFFFSTMAHSAPTKNTLLKEDQVINIDNELKVELQKTIANENVFKVIEVKSDSTYQELGYKKGDVIKKVNNETIFNQKQLKTALDRQATEWENTSFDNDFSEGDIDIDNKSFEEIEEEISL